MDFYPLWVVFRPVGRKTTHKNGKYHAAVHPEPVEGQAKLLRASVLIQKKKFRQEKTLWLPKSALD